MSGDRDHKASDYHDAADWNANGSVNVASVIAHQKSVAAATRLVDGAAHQVSERLKLPFVAHPHCITDVSGRSIRRVLAVLSRSKTTTGLRAGDWKVSGVATFQSVIGSCHLAPGEIYTDLVQGKLRFWTLSFASSPIHAHKSPWSQNHTPPFLAPNGLVALQTDIPWPNDLPNFSDPPK